MNEVSFASKMWSTGGEPDASAEIPAVDTTDATDFAQWLRAGPQPAADPASPSSLGEILRTASWALHEREHAFDKSLRRAGATGDPLDGLAVQRNLSELYLSHGLAVKVIGKTTQALEQLTRLQ
jgi:hypothetical protein